MTYYFVSLKSAKFNEFPERFPMFEEGKWIESGEDLEAAIAEADEGICFFVDFLTIGKEIDKWILRIRESLPEAKVVYVTTDHKAAELKSHQLSPVGGDAYISRQVNPDTLERILSGFQAEFTNLRGNKLESTGFHQVMEQFDLSGLHELKADPLSKELDEVFEKASAEKKVKPKFQSLATLNPEETDDSGVNMSDSDKEFSLSNMEDLELSETPDLPQESADADEGLSLDLDSGIDLSLDDSVPDLSNDQKSDVQLEGGLGELDLGGAEEMSLDSSRTLDEPSGLVLSDDALDESLDFGSLDGEISPDAKEKLAEIDAIMEEDSKITQLPDDLDLEAADLLTGTGKPAAEEVVAEGDSLEFGGIDDSIAASSGEEEASELSLDDGFAIADIPAAGTDDRLDSDLDQPLVGEDLDLASLDFGMESEPEEVKAKPLPEPVPEEIVSSAPVEEKEKTSTKIRRKKEKEKEEKERELPAERPMGQELREISGAYSAELERMQATLSNLRSDREELLARIQRMEEEKLLHNRQGLSLRAELDEKKIELSIVRKKLNEDISELKDRVRLEEERRLILEEKNRVLREELDKSAQKNRFDVKKVQLRERELEQKLELLKADAETQIRNRDLKILELKRKIDAMEFDMESMQSQEKRTVESRFELEDKLEKAIKTLRNAISVLEDETDKTAALDALKKNIDM